MTRRARYKCKFIYQGRVWRWTRFSIPSNHHLTVWLDSSQPAEWNMWSCQQDSSSDWAYQWHIMTCCTFDRNNTIYNTNNPTHTPTKTFLWNRGIWMKRLEFCDSTAYHPDYSAAHAYCRHRVKRQGLSWGWETAPLQVYERLHTSFPFL